MEGWTVVRDYSTRRSTSYNFAWTRRQIVRWMLGYHPLSRPMIDRLLGFTTLHDSRRYAIPRCLDPSHPDTKVRLTGDDEYAPTNLGTRPGRRSGLLDCST